MLKSRNLDDQNYADIVEQAVKKIPQLCSGWTNFNPSDPGITFLELFAWYKEMQQYHLNYYTDEMRLSLLKLLGETPKGARAAQCTIEAAPDGKSYRRGQKLATPEQVVFELEEEIPEKRTEIAGFYILKGSERRDIAPAISGGSDVPVFSFGEDENTDFLITFREISDRGLSIWFDIKDPGFPGRNPFRSGQAMPRKLRFELSGCGEVTPVVDETCALSRSGFIRFDASLRPGKVTSDKDPVPVASLKISLTDPGCEEQVYVRSISASRYRVSQKDTRSLLFTGKTLPGKPYTFVSDHAISEEGLFLCFVREKNGWQQIPADVKIAGEKTEMDIGNANPVQDGKDNIMISVMDSMHLSDLAYSFSGLPDETIRLETEGKTALTENMVLICRRNGHDEVFHCVENLKSCGPEERVFSYNAAAGEIRFGDGEHGRIPDPGENVILAAQLQLTGGKDGNIPAGKRLFFPYEEEPVSNTEAFGGQNPETADELAAAFLQKMESPHVCVNADDYRKMALSTPGLRVLKARAIPGYDPEEPSGQGRTPVVTVIVIPAGYEERPVPNEMFLREVREYLEEYRNIGTILKVFGPRYFPFDLNCDLIVSSKIREEDVLRVLSEEFHLRADQDSPDIGKPVKVGELYRILSELPGVITVKQITIRSRSAECSLAPDGDLRLPPDGVPYPAGIRIIQH